MTATDHLAKLYDSIGDTIKSKELYYIAWNIRYYTPPFPSDHSSKTLVPDAKVKSWSEHVENLVACGDTDGAISYLELLICHLEPEVKGQDLELSTAMEYLAKLYGPREDNFWSEELYRNAYSIRSRTTEQWSTPIVSDHLRVAGPSKENNTEESTLSTTANNGEETCVDDSETLAETDISLLSLKPKTEASQPESGNLGQKETDNSSSISDKKPKREGNGSFLYNGST